MTDSNTPLPTPGWYPDPAGGPHTRWWNGSSWSDSYGEPAAAAAQAAEPAAAVSGTPWASPSAGQPTAPAAGYPGAPAYPAASGNTNAPAYAGAPAYTGSPAYGSPEPLRAPEGTSPNTPFIWPLALLPVVAVVINIVSLGLIDQVVDEAMSDTAVYSPISLITSVVGWVMIGLTILFGVLDYRALVRAGVPKPFHWAWIFFAFVSAPVYMIGRSIIVRRRTGTGLAPMFVNLALIAVNVILGIVSFFIGFTAAMESVPAY